MGGAEGGDWFVRRFVSGRDPFLREWLKVPTRLLRSGAWKALTLEQRGVFYEYLMNSLIHSQTPGYYLDPLMGEPADVAAISADIGGPTPDRDGVVQRALEALERVELMRFDPDNGWHVPPELYEIFLHENNRTAKREADAKRARRYRERKKDREQELAQHAERRAAEVVRPMRRRGGQEGQ